MILRIEDWRYARKRFKAAKLFPEIDYAKLWLRQKKRQWPSYKKKILRVLRGHDFDEIEMVDPTSENIGQATPDKVVHLPVTDEESRKSISISHE